MSARAASLLVLLVALSAGDARAQDKVDTDTPIPPPKEEPPSVTGPQVAPDLWMDIMMSRSWSEGQPRLFIATTLDVGWVYLRPRVSLGYGTPFNKWVGVDVNPTVSGNAVGFYGGLRLNLPRINWRGGVRYTFALYRTYLDPQDSYDRTDFDIATNPRSRALTFETEVEGSIPLGPGEILGLLSLSYVTNVPHSQLVFEETLRVIVDPPLVWRVRGGYMLRLGSQKQHSAGLVVDVLDVPDRDDSLTVRVGPLVRVVLSRRVEVRGSFVVTVVSPDELGLAGSDFTEIGLRYRWASN